VAEELPDGKPVAVCTGVIPLQRNDGSPVAKKERRALVRKVVRRFNGATVRTDVRGHWVDEEGKYYNEPVQELKVVCALDRVGELEEVMHDIGRQLGQKEVYFEVCTGVQVRFLRVTNPVSNQAPGAEHILPRTKRAKKHLANKKRAA
jgi:hypothetical protein